MRNVITGDIVDLRTEQPIFLQNRVGLVANRAVLQTQFCLLTLAFRHTQKQVVTGNLVF
jgi:hypothetical protein